MNNAVDVLVLGGGPGGYTAALYAARAGLSVLVLERLSAGGQMATTGTVENYPGFEDGVDGFELGEKMQRQAQRFGARTVLAEVREVALTESPKRVETDRGTFLGRTVVVATGAEARELGVPGEAALRGRGVSYCATCDAFFYRGKTAAVLGSGEYALHEVQALLPLAGKVILCTNGEPLTADFPEGVEICTEKLAAVEGEEKVSALRLENGELLPVEGLFVALGVAGSAALARKLGAPVENGRIVVDERMQTGIPGLYAAGDCTGGLLQVCKAVYEGALAATEAIKQIRGKK